jgi:hypothetical protein
MHEVIDRRAHERINSIEAVLILQQKELTEITRITRENHEVVSAIYETMQLFRWINSVISWVAKRIYKFAFWATPIVGLWIYIKDWWKGH